MTEDEKLHELEEKIGHSFKDRSILKHALCHTSWANEQNLGHGGSNERLEFLGDAVLEAVSSEYLYHYYPDRPEGDLSKIRASLVCEPALAYDARQFGLQEYLYLGRGEDATGGRTRDSVVSDALEATIGAVFLDGGFDEAKKYIMRYVRDDVEHKQLFHDSKTKLQEIIQSEALGTPEYEIISERGPEHNKQFEACVKTGGRVIGTGTGHSKKAAEQQAAYHAIIELRKNEKNVS
jgi:ribonuclease-3